MAALSLMPAFTEPGALVLAASFALFAGAVRFAEWFSAISTTPAERKVLEARLRDREGRRQGHGR